MDGLNISLVTTLSGEVQAIDPRRKCCTLLDFLGSTTV